MNKARSGYKEMAHTADREILVWAPSLEELLIEAAKGMYSIMNIKINPTDLMKRRLEVDAIDGEMLLVSFLSELLFYIEDEHIAFNKFSLKLKNYFLEAYLSGGIIQSGFREIKAVTYHNLSIQEENGILRTRIVFDV